MKTILDKATRDKLIARINTLDEGSAPQWGKMNVYQMLKHCSLVEEMYLGKAVYKRVFIGRIFGRIALKNLTKNEKPLGKNVPTVSNFKVEETTGDMVTQRNRWISLIEDYANLDNPYFEHSFFGKMTKEQVGILAYKHTDHHLRQFGK